MAPMRALCYREVSDVLEGVMVTIPLAREVYLGTLFVNNNI